MEPGLRPLPCPALLLPPHWSIFGRRERELSCSSFFLFSCLSLSCLLLLSAHSEFRSRTDLTSPSPLSSTQTDHGYPNPLLPPPAPTQNSLTGTAHPHPLTLKAQLVFSKGNRRRTSWGRNLEPNLVRTLTPHSRNSIILTNVSEVESLKPIRVRGMHVMS